MMRWLGWLGAVALGVLLYVYACQLLPTDEGDTVLKQQVSRLRLSLIGETGGGDSLLIGVAFDTISDVSGIDHVNWQNWGIAPPEITADTSSGMTKTMVDTVQVRKPPINSTDTYNIRAHAVDKASNAGGWSPPHEWSIIHGDTTGPLPPGIVLEDTIRIYTSVTLMSITVWEAPIPVPRWTNADGSCDSAPCTYPAIALSVYDDGGVLCTDGPYNQESGDGDRDRATPAPWTMQTCYDAADSLGVDYTAWAGRRYSFVDWSAQQNGDVEKECWVSFLGEVGCIQLQPPAANVYQASADRLPSVVRRPALVLRPIEPGSLEFYGLDK